MSQPLAIDLFCGLSEAKLLHGTNPAIKKLVACRAQNPDHMTLRVGNNLPRAVSFELRLVNNLKNARLPAGFAGIWKSRIFSAKATDHRILERSPGIVNLLNARFFTVKIPLPLSRYIGATFRPQIAQAAE